MKKVAVIMGSDSDFDKLKDCFTVLKEFGVEYEAHVISAHRTPEKAAAFASAAREKDFGVIICAAGKAAHLAGVFAGHTILPVIGIPMGTRDLGGMDSLLSTVQMPKGVPVATVAIDGAANAAYLALQMLALSDSGLADKLASYKKKMADSVAEKDKAITLAAADL